METITSIGGIKRDAYVHVYIYMYIMHSYLALHSVISVGLSTVLDCLRQVTGFLVILTARTILTDMNPRSC